MYAGTLCYNGSTNATRFFVMSAGPTGSLVFAGMNPSVTYGDSGGAWRVRLNAFSEQNSDPDGPQQTIINIDQHGATGCYRHQWIWNGPYNVAIEEDATQGLTLHELRETARSHCKNGGGERIFAPPHGGPRAEIIDFGYGSDAGHVLIKYNIFNNPYDFPAGTPCTIQLRYGEDKKIPHKRAKIYNPNIGTLLEEDTVISIPSSQSGNIYTFEWNFGADAITSYSMPNVAILISTTGVA
jgi:hypothetical protein